MPIRVALAEGNALLRQGLARLLESSADLAHVGTAPDLPSAQRLVTTERPDVVVTDIAAPRGRPVSPR